MIVLSCLSAFACLAGSMMNTPLPNSYDVVWTTPSKDASGSMPIGNGEVVLNVWVEEKTGDILFYIARTDAMSEISRYLKLGKVRIHFAPNSPGKAPDFRQQLHLQDGRIEIAGGGIRLDLYVDAHSNVVHVQGESRDPVILQATFESWRMADRALPAEEGVSAWSVHNAPFSLIESADRLVEQDHSGVTWYHRNETSIVGKVLENQSLVGAAGAFDPLLHRTFGGRLEGVDFAKDGSHSIVLQHASRSFGVQVATHTAIASSIDDWLKGLERVSARGRQPNSLASTRSWWREFWQRSWVAVEERQHQIGQSYNLQRYVQACQGRGEFPIKFNGGYYTVEPAATNRPFNADWRNWGDCHWFQNVRHMYHPMLASGDFEMMEPFFRLYESALPLAESRTKHYHNAEGAYFPETMTVFGTYSGGDYGWDRTNHEPKDVDCKYWQYAWNQGPELLGLMLDRWDYTRDTAFLQKRILPMAKSVLRYFDTRFKKDESGRIVLNPTQVVETYWYEVVNDMPTTAGLISVTNRLCMLPKDLVDKGTLATFERMKQACPSLPIAVIDGKRMLAPAQKYKTETSNCENGELYGIWPFRVVSLAHPEHLKEAIAAYDHRLNHLDTGWGYDGNVAALLGLSKEAARILEVKCDNSNKSYRWPATWGPNYDWLPDQNHGGNLLNTTNLMLMQAEPIEAGGEIRVLPAWPHEWDVDFKLHAPGNTTVHAVARGGKVVKLEVLPESRRKDIVVSPEWLPSQ